ncbi:MAG: hypothetical protein A2X36_09540 [Elusimicrobia bacterium GWA2_69_24]|nr:MAG: hypothetical protein A2X36_09540 [Elusimicrobia bacterium GWA2_69_24]HBL15592.1 hypothetical protein [Elusimicrobiota bacterium]
MKILRICTLRNGWCDKDHVLLHAAFQLLVDFIEQEKPDTIIDWKSDPASRRAWKEICALHGWWSLQRPARRSPLDASGLKKPPMRWTKTPGSASQRLLAYDKHKYAAYDSALKKHWRLEQKWLNEDQRNLHRLIDIRQFLWT